MFFNVMKFLSNVISISENWILCNKDLNFLIHLFKDINDNGNANDVFDNMGKLSLKLASYIIRDRRLLSILFKGLRCIV